jgi:4-methyl-5(b-hydroxyethyl)-thiazole monophosphate biosynthesis
MRFAIFVYPNFAQFEVIFASYFLNATKGKGTVVSSDGGPARSMEGFLVAADGKLSDLDLGSIDLFILPGGQEADIADQEGLHAALRKLDAERKVIAAICGGPLQLARAGLLKGRKFTSSVAAEHPDAFSGAMYVEKNVVVDGNIVTAQPHGYVDMALELGKIFDIYRDEADYLETVQAFREQRRPDTTKGE